MDSLKIKIVTMPAEKVNWLIHLKDVVLTMTPWAGIVSICWRGIDRYFKWLSEGREAQLTKIVDAHTTELKEGIKELREAIWALKREING